MPQKQTQGCIYLPIRLKGPNMLPSPVAHKASWLFLFCLWTVVWFCLHGSLPLLLFSICTITIWPSADSSTFIALTPELCPQGCQCKFFQIFKSGLITCLLKSLQLCSIHSRDVTSVFGLLSWPICLYFLLPSPAMLKDFGVRKTAGLLHPFGDAPVPGKDLLSALFPVFNTAQDSTDSLISYSVLTPPHPSRRDVKPFWSTLYFFTSRSLQKFEEEFTIFTPLSLRKKTLRGIIQNRVW